MKSLRGDRPLRSHPDGDADQGVLHAGFSTEEVKKVENVRAVETFVVYKSLNLKVPLPMA